MNNCNARGFQRGACQSAGVTLREYKHIGNVTGAPRAGAGVTHKGGVAFLQLWNSCVDTHETLGGWGRHVQLSGGRTPEIWVIKNS